MFHLSKETLLAHPLEACNSLQSRSLLISFHLCILSCWDCWISKSHYVYNHNNPVSVIIHHVASEIDCFLLSVTSWDPSAAAARSLQSCPTLCDPIDGSPPGSPSLGFSRQEHWSGLPFPSPVHESENWKWSRSVESDILRPRELQPTRLLHPWDFPGKSTGVGCHRLLHICNLLHCIYQ